jgi:excisionase family DNA binding protein
MFLRISHLARSDGILTARFRPFKRCREALVRDVYSGANAAPITSPNLGRLRIMNDRKTISIMKACELVGVSRRTIYNWISSGKVEYIRTAGGSVRIFVDTLWRQPSRADLTTKEAS